MTTHCAYAFIQALQALIQGLSCVAIAYDHPRIMSQLQQDTDSGGLVVDLTYLPSTERYRVHNAQDRLRDLVVRIYAPAYSSAMICGQNIMDAINLDVTIGGTAIWCKCVAEDAPRYWNPHGNTWIKDIIYQVRLRRDIP